MVVNPVSGAVDKKPIIDLAISVTSQKGHQLRIFETTGKNDKENLTAVTKDYQPNRFLMAGGDGTIKLLAEILQGEMLPIGILTAGSANGLAENLDLPDALEERLEIALGEHFIHLDVIRINDEYCLHISDIGLNAALIKNYQEGNIRGKLGYLIQSIPTLVQSDFPFGFKLEFEDKTLFRKAVLVAVANARRYGTGSTINPNGSYDDGKFEVLVFKEFNIREILKTFREEVQINRDFMEIYQTSRITIECEKSIPFQIDGEYRGEVRKVTAEIAPVKIKIAVPEFKATASLKE